MVPERKSGQSSFEEKISLIKETTIEHGGHTPTLIVEGSKRPVMMQFEAVPDSHEKTKPYINCLSNEFSFSSK